jgi:hypothetical protein
MHRRRGGKQVLAGDHGGRVPAAGQQAEHEQARQCQRGHRQGAKGGPAHRGGRAAASHRAARGDPAGAAVATRLIRPETTPG